MCKYYKLYGALSILHTLSTKAEKIELWDSEQSKFQPNIMREKSAFRPAISNLDDLYSERQEMHARYGKDSIPSLDRNQKHNSGHYSYVGYIYNPNLKRYLGFRRNEGVGYSPALGFGSNYKKAVFSIYHLTEEKGSSVALLTNDKILVSHFASPEYSREKPVLERIPGLLNNNNEVQVNVGPISSRSFKLLGISESFKNFVLSKEKLDVTRDTRTHQDFAIKSVVSEKYIAASADNHEAEFKSIDECEVSPAMCTYNWVPYKETQENYSQ
ncbi:hypothetical protein NEMIN01_0540 [Nematocida minor]|uniref:uncharacterized protein n=1 Tax=Nematocida minor TaxID=1912983 RepID=UPI002220C523|nr:uncharacterized protein NEMIN01_0540 [Nematocida minor]KAI5189477.1 hypothetical protein NEMIN01_0540 [Nematocida minor]